jgi:hypothetical protein
LFFGCVSFLKVAYNGYDLVMWRHLKIVSLEPQLNL